MRERARGIGPLLSALARAGRRPSPPVLAIQAAAPGSRFDRPWTIERLIDLVPHSVVALEPDGSPLHANPAARAEFGDALAALLRHKRLADAIALLDAETIATVEIAMDVPVRRVVRAALRLDRGPPVGTSPTPPGLILLSLTDRTEQAAIERMRIDFVANASHELRTPLASLIGFIETLQGPAADDAPARVRFLAIMSGQAARMRRLIDNLLSLSRIQMQEHERPDGRVVLADLLARIADEHEPQVAAARATLAVEVAPDLPAIAGDADQLAQVLQNLLDNALKYGVRPGTPGGPPGATSARLLLSAQAAQPGRDPSADGVVLQVSDDGPGIAARHLPRLTERFYRVDEGPKTGSGLGLAIVKHIVGRHGGRLSVRSEPGHGACFSVWLPVHADRRRSPRD